MNNQLLLVPLFVFVWPVLLAQQSPISEPPPPVVFGLTPAAPVSLADNQKIYRQPVGYVLLVPPEEVNTIMMKFRTAYGSPGAPRLVICVNRELVDTTSGLKLTGHTENYEKTDNSSKTSGVNTYKASEATAPTLADQKTAVDLLADKPGQRLLGDQAAKEREALMAIADIAVEVLISSRNLTVPGISGDQIVSAPDIQATAIRLKDSSIVGQASASDVLGKGALAGLKEKNFDVRDITEATSIALMEDMLLGAK